jgi:hypothetical protein
MTQVAIDDGLVKEAVRLSDDKTESEIVEQALKIYIGQMSLRSMFGSIKDDDLWDIEAESEKAEFA